MGKITCKLNSILHVLCGYVVFSVGQLVNYDENGLNLRISSNIVRRRNRYSECEDVFLFFVFFWLQFMADHREILALKKVNKVQNFHFFIGLFITRCDAFFRWERFDGWLWEEGVAEELDIKTYRMSKITKNKLNRIFSQVQFNGESISWPSNYAPKKRCLR